MLVVKNTYPTWPNVAHAEPGDIVEWKSERSNKFSLIRQSDGASVFSRDAYPHHTLDDRPVVGVIAQVKSKGWVFEIEKGKNNGSV